MGGVTAARDATPPSRVLAAECLAVAAGAMLGAGARWGATELVTARPGGLPLATALVNLLGCLLAGAATGWMRRGSAAWLVLVTGTLGGFTTFSTFTLDTRHLLAERAWGVAAGYLALTVAGGLAAATLGRAAVRRTATP